MAGDGDAGTGSMGAVPLRSAQMMGHKNKQKQLKVIAAKTVLFERRILAGLMFNRSICIQHKLQVTLIIVSADYKSVDV